MAITDTKYTGKSSEQKLKRLTVNKRESKKGKTFRFSICNQMFTNGVETFSDCSDSEITTASVTTLIESMLRGFHINKTTKYSTLGELHCFTTTYDTFEHKLSINITEVL